MRVFDENLTRRTEEPTFFDLPPVAAANHSDDEANLDMRFAQWIDANPAVLAVFIQVAERFQREGRRKTGSKRIVEQMRWDMQLTTQGDPFKINNNFVSRLGRLAVKRRPELASLFDFRELRS